MKTIKIIGLILGIFAASTFAMLWHFTPIFNPHPPLTGPYAVGIRSYTFIDASRPMHENSAHEPRALPVDIYYPAHGDKTATYPYKPTYYKALADYYARHSILPQFVTQLLLHNITSHAAPDAPINDDKATYPVILFSSGIGSSMTYATYLEDLASAGYIVVDVQHPYDVDVCVFPDGKVIEIDTEFKAAIKKTDREFIYPYRGRAHWIWLADVQHALTRLEQLNNDPAFDFYHKLDLNRIGSLGHSHGGAVMIDLVKHDVRIKAGINMDGWTKTANTLEGFNKPFMFLLNDTSGNDRPELQLYENMKNANNHDASSIIIHGAGHTAFSDYIQLKWPLQKLIGVAHGDATKIRTQIQDAMRTFFNRYLTHSSLE